jgi:hypothetical protein
MKTKCKESTISQLPQIILMMWFITGMSVTAQPKITAFTDFETNNVSGGLIIRTAGMAGFRYKNNYLETGVQTNVKNINKNIISGFNMKFSKRLQIREFPFETQTFFIYAPVSDVFHETNWGLLLNITGNHFELKAGTNFRTFALNTKRSGEYTQVAGTKLHETWNMIYLIRYNLKPNDSSWNIGLAITDLDEFSIEQETNPVFNLKAVCKINTNLSLFAETWYKSAGAFNMQVNYFGCKLKIGLSWTLN